MSSSNNFKFDDILTEDLEKALIRAQAEKLKERAKDCRFGIENLPEIERECRRDTAAAYGLSHIYLSLQAGAGKAEADTFLAERREQWEQLTPNLITAIKDGNSYHIERIIKERYEFQ